MPPAAQQVQLARQLAQQAQQQQVQQAPPVQQQAPPVQPQTQQPTPAAAQQQVQQPAQTAQQQQAEQSSAGRGRSSGSAAHNGSGASNGAVRSAGHLGSGGSGGGTSRAVTPTGGSSNPPTRTSTLGSAGSLMVDIRPWEISYKQLTLLQSIGAGSFGKVYKAKWHETLVAVKVLLDLEHVNDASMTLSNPVLINLHKECSLMASLRHPNIVQFMGVCSCPPAMITEFCGKGSLTDVLKAGKASPAKAALLSWQRRLNMALDAAKGMLYLHKRGIVHRDLKSPNLLVDQVWRVKVADFNLSKLVEGTDSCNSKTGTMAGANPKWLAPEVIGGFSATEKGDVFSYGVVLWELLTWEIPWNKVSPWTVVATLMNGGTLAMPPLDDATQPLPGSAADNATFAPHLPAYTALIKRCWAHNQFDRPSFEEVIHDLRSICEGLLRAPAGEAQQ
jgi:serine/threonine protein kinase